MSPLSPEHEALSHLLLSPAWNGIVKTTIGQRVKLYYDKLIDPDEHRKERLPDDYIRGYVAACRWVLTFPQEEMNRAVEAIIAEQAPPPQVEPLFGRKD